MLRLVPLHVRCSGDRGYLPAVLPTQQIARIHADACYGRAIVQLFVKTKRITPISQSFFTAAKAAESLAPS
jgi:hypothetical protein